MIKGKRLETKLREREREEEEGERWRNMQLKKKHTSREKGEYEKMGNLRYIIQRKKNND